MRVAVGYGDNPEGYQAAKAACINALEKSQNVQKPDVALLFHTAALTEKEVRRGVTETIGEILIYGGGTVGVITNDIFGYAGNQVGVALFWLEDSCLDVLSLGNLSEGEAGVGKELGEKLRGQGVTRESSLMLFYDAVNAKQGGIIMATYLLEGLKKGLGFMPELVGAGLQGDHMCAPVKQFLGERITESEAMTLSFSDDIAIDNVIMHGCEPASTYFTVTKAEEQTILEINGEPAIPFIEKALGGRIHAEQFPFFLIFGINHGEDWAPYDENNYASRLCLGIDKERAGIVMFEPDMQEGTRFQIMYRSLKLDYMRPKVRELFSPENLEGKEPLFALYIDCAGRCAGYSGKDLEDAVVIQEEIGDKVPLLGLYTGVEIAPIGGQSRGLDWTGVLCLVSKKTGAIKKKEVASEWEDKEDGRKVTTPATTEALEALISTNAAKALELDAESVTIRQELEQKRRGFSLLVELSTTLHSSEDFEESFGLATRRINAALNMQKTVVFVAQKNGKYKAEILQGFTPEETYRITDRAIELPTVMLADKRAVIINSDTSLEFLQDIREFLGLRYFVSMPIVLGAETVAVLVTGRMEEQTPFLSKLGEGDGETVQAIAAQLASVMASQRLMVSEERSRIMVDNMPLVNMVIDDEMRVIDCNEQAVSFFGAKDKKDVIQHYQQFLYSNNGKYGETEGEKHLLKAFLDGRDIFRWSHKRADGKDLVAEVTLVRVPNGERYNVICHLRDLTAERESMEEMQRAKELAEENVRQKNEFLASISHEVRTPLNSILAMAREASKLEESEEGNKILKNGVHSAHLLAASVDALLDFSQAEAGMIKPVEKEFSPGEAIDSVAEILKEEAKLKDLDLEVRYEGAPIAEKLIGDGVRLEQILYNLVANGIKFTRTGGVTIHVSERPSPATKGITLTIAVEDTGVGISEESREKLFVPLTQVDTAYDKKSEGMGMGLALSKTLASLLGGEITYASRSGGGSIFTVAIPFALAGKQEKPDYGRLAGKKVLVVEDNMINQIIMVELLKKVGIEVSTAGDGLEALEALKKSAFDVVLMDVQMPRMDGLTATEEIRKQKKYHDLPIIAVTAHASPEHREESRRSGMNGHLTKPVEVDELYQTVLTYI
ncbi:PAS domain S-box-containing protein [Lachnospiraceae bacterium PFB1-21]|uniref:response regulator n=1 Tax=Ohessyouella blattaphilus TaxID=2949333 RepID=UPI003E2777ED